MGGQVAIWFQASGANLTTSGGDYSFEQALLLASVMAPATGDLSLVLGVDEAHDVMSPLLDPSAAQGELSDGGGALLVQPWRPNPSPCLALLVPYEYQRARPEHQSVTALIHALGGEAAIAERFAAIFVGIPFAEQALGKRQLEGFLRATHFSGPVVDYRRLTGQYASASATAAVWAVDCVARGALPSQDDESPPRTTLKKQGILLLGLGQKIAAVGVLPPEEHNL
jgi:3-oxoacyl-[acyl-carrier-protein] synthase-1/3-oxoacyl-[acyl-carrier-protein] synthase II